MEPGRFPLPLLYEAAARGACECLKPTDREAVKHELRWACRPLQSVLKDLGNWGYGSLEPTRCGPYANRHARGVLDIQETIGECVIDYLADAEPDWVDEIAESTWHEVGGW